ncbi:DMT family transporter [Chelatococcus reniformis]|uniref:Membrane protein n=1 Tax=Chelatococcus reniformis TaxID=1494448 RepID=A0A916ULX3_9HYPH|nr:DMT family transporter [Chelatococcus reniformis]GGC77720.1 membrane protein [Chelatococcus reniformis]
MILASVTPARRSARGIAYACAVVALFASFVLVSRLGLSSALTLPDIAALRFSVGGLLLCPILLKHGLSGLQLREAAVLAVLGGLGFALFAYAGFALAPAAHGAILIHGTLSLTTALLLWLVFGGRIERRQRMALTAIAAGIVVMVWDGLRQASIPLLAGDLCLLLASACWSGYGLYVKRLALPAVRAAAIVAGLSAIVFLPLYAVMPGKMLFQAEWRDLLVQAVFQGVLIGALSVFVYTRAIVLLGASDVAMSTAAVPALTTLGGFLLLGEVPTSVTLVGLALVTLGMATGLRRGS